MFTRKSLFVALTVIAMLALLVPVATAAPEWVHSIKITAPTTANPAYVDPANPGLNTFTVKYDLTIVGTQVDDVNLRIRAIDINNSVVVWEWQKVWPGNSLKTGVNSLTSAAVTPAWNPGWYRVQACAMDGDWGRELFCDQQDMAVLIDLDNPGAKLVKPLMDAWVTGNDYLMVGKAWDPWWAENDTFMRYGKIASTAFSYCVITNWQGDWCGPKDASWVTLGAGTPSGVPDEYQYVWDSTQVPDDLGVVRFCAVDLVGRTACDWATIHVENRFTINLRPGWNLISTPLLLYNTDISAALSHLKDANGNPTWTKIYAMTNDPAAPNKYVWTMHDAAGGALTDFVDGQGYWIQMKTTDQLTFVGSWKSFGDTGTPVAPPEYQVQVGWNLIGYTHWGQPTSWPNKLVADYLGMPLAPSVEALWRYDSVSETYVPMYLADPMLKGAGYWLATADAGTINP